MDKKTESLFKFPKFDFSSNNKKFFYVIFFVIFLLVLNYSLIIPPKDFPVNTIVNIEEGSSLRAVSRKFKELKIIKSRILFETTTIALGGERVIAGDYLLDKKINVFTISRRVSKGYKNLAPVKVTIPEGFTNKEIAEVFSVKLARFDEKIFLSSAEKLQGYLFPDTYFFLSTDGERDVVNAMRKNFDAKIESLNKDILLSGKTKEDIVVMASLIEEESKGEGDREMISGILWKRLKIGMPLQVDAEPSTYKEKGLPTYAISNPGILSILASIHPKESKYLYYLHDKNGVIHYGANYSEHLKNIRTYLRQ